MAAGAPLAAISFATLLGMGVLAALLMLLALAGALTPPGVATVFGLALAGAVGGHQVLLAGLKAAARSLRALPTLGGGFALTIAALGALVLLLIARAALSAPTGDAEAFYFTYAKIIAASGTLGEMPGLYAPFSQIGLLGEFHIAALLTVAGLPAAKLTVWTAALAAGVELTSLCAAAGVTARGRWIALAVLFTSTAFTNHLWDGKVDVFAAAFGLGAVRAIVQANASRAGLFCAGLLAGFACVSKFSYIPTLLSALVLLLAWTLWPAGLRKAWKSLAAAAIFIGGGFAAAWLPHVVKSSIVFGLPLAPFVGGADTSWMQQVWFDARDTLWIVATYPLALTFGRYPMQSGNVSFVLLALAPLTMFLKREGWWHQSILAQCTAAGLAGILIWLIFRPSVIAPRYFFANLALLIPVVARAGELAYKSGGHGQLLGSAMSLTMLSAIAFTAYPHVLSLRSALVTSREAPGCVLASPYCAPLLEINARTAPGERIYLAGFYFYWLRSDLLQCQATAAELRRVHALDTPSEKIQFLRQRGFRHVAIDKSGAPEDLRTLAAPELVSSGTVLPVLETSEILVLQIVSPQGHESAGCKQVERGRWSPNPLW
jgi:hypothetical protein